MHKQRNKLKNADIVKIRRRFDMKKEEYEGKTLEELKEIYNTVKMSSTDRHALVIVTEQKMENEAVLKAEIVEYNPENVENGGPTEEPIQDRE